MATERTEPVKGIIFSDSNRNNFLRFLTIPDEVSETMQANWEEETEIIARSAPFMAYKNSAGRKVGLSLIIHSDTSAQEVQDQVRWLQATQLPEYGQQIIKPPPLFRMYIGTRWMAIRGVLVLTGDVAWNSPFIGDEGIPHMATVGIEMTEVFDELPDRNSWLSDFGETFSFDGPVGLGRASVGSDPQGNSI